MKTATHLFDGEQLTVQQIRQRVPVLSEDTILKYLSEGVNTKAGMLAYDINNPRQYRSRDSAKAWKTGNGSYTHHPNSRRKAKASGFVPRQP